MSSSTSRATTRPVRTGWRRAALVAAVAVALSATPQAAHASVSTTPEKAPKTNGTVFAIAQAGPLTVIGGTFTLVGGQPRQNIAAIRADGTVDPDFTPAVDGPVRALAASTDGSRVFVGGLFSTAGGAARANLAALHIGTGAAVEDWQADTVGASPEVLGLAVAGDSLYVGGPFAGIDGTQRRRLAAVGATSGVVSDTFRPSPDALVKAVAVSPDGTKVYAGGNFTAIGGQTRLHSAAEVLADTGAATAFAPTQGGGKVVTVGLSPDGSRFYFSTENNTLFSYDVTSDVPVWSIKTSGNTQAIAVSATEVYIGGHFSQIVTTKTPRNLAASLNPADGSVTDWDLDLEGRAKGVWAISLRPTGLDMGGGFTTIGGVKQRGFARFAGTP
jgi:hypothetical protein